MSLFQIFSVGASGLTAQRMRAEIIAENLANADTTRTPEGGPYRRKDAIFETQAVASPFAGVLEGELHQSSGVAVSEIHVDDREAQKRYAPGHPDADADGYVQVPRVNPAEDMVDLMSAARGYQANVSAVSAAKDMIHRSLDLMR